MNSTDPETTRSDSPHDQHDWAIVLAAGDGTRLHALTTLRRGLAVPKQFCSLNGGPSLLRQAVDRASAVVSAERVLVVVAEDHRRWWETELRDLPLDSIVVQPSNRGTAAGILLPLLTILDRDAEARVVVVPSDHFVANEEVLARAVRRALNRVSRRSRVVLLGISPESPEPGFGWIVPSARHREGLTAVSRFVEKPSRRVATRLMQQGAVWNSFLFAARAGCLLEEYRCWLPELAGALENLVRTPSGFSPSRLEHAYRSLPVFDFSRDLVELATDTLEVVTVPGCGWSDLGTPDRVADCLRQADLRFPAGAAHRPAAPLDLSLDRLRLVGVR